MNSSRENTGDSQRKYQENYENESPRNESDSQNPYEIMPYSQYSPKNESS
jgi:hypothetical protein